MGLREESILTSPTRRIDCVLIYPIYCQSIHSPYSFCRQTCIRQSISAPKRAVFAALGTNTFSFMSHELTLLCFTSFQSSQTSSVDVSPAVTGRIDPSELHHLGALHDFLTRTLLRWMAESGRSELEPLRQGRRP